jgi:hypothetical protein
MSGGAAESTSSLFRFKPLSLATVSRSRVQRARNFLTPISKGSDDLGDRERSLIHCVDAHEGVTSLALV